MERVSGMLALDEIFAPCSRDGEGCLNLWLGNTRMGKSFANRILVNEMLRRKHTDTVFTVDEKDPEKPQYEGVYRANVKHLYNVRLNPFEKPEHIVFRGIAYRSDLKDVVNHGEVANLVWDIKRTTPKSRLMLNIDELADATNGHQSWLSDSNAQIYRKGAGIRISTTATTQLPQLLPREAFGLSQSIGLFQLDKREVDYLVRFRLVTDDVVPRMEGLKQGDFLLYIRGKGLMPDVYRF